MSDERAPSPESAEVTQALAEIAGGVPSANTRLLELVYAELRRIAAAKMAALAPAHTLQPTALVHEAYLRLIGRAAGDSSYRDSGHFFAAAATAMRTILIDYARRKQAGKRGGQGLRVTLHPDVVGEALPEERVLEVHEALEQLAREHERPARVVELLFFAGLSMDEAARVLDVSERTVKRDWRFARAWLLRAMGEDA